jgi:hypothetical protein
MAGQTVVDGKRDSDKSYNAILPTEKLRPLGNRLIVEVLPLKLSSTIIADWQGEAVRGRVIAAGPGGYPNIHLRGTKPGKDGKPESFHIIRKSKHFRPNAVKVGDIVQLGGMEIGGYLFKHVQVDGKDCIYCTEDDVTGVE